MKYLASNQLATIIGFAPYQRAQRRPLDVKLKVFNKMLAGPVIPPRALSKADRRYVNKKIKLFVRDISKTLSKNEQKRLTNLKKSRDAKIACKFTIAYFRYLLQDARMTSLAVRYGDEF